MPQLVLAQSVQEVRLVLGLVRGAGEQRPRPVRRLHDPPPGVVPGRDRLALVQVARLAQQRAELHHGVAVDARAGRPPAEVRGEERLDDAGPELALEVHDVERDPEPGGDPSRVVGRVGRAAAAAVLGVRVRHVVQAHPHADDLVALLVEEGRRDRAVHAARHGDQDPAHRAAASAVRAASVAATAAGDVSRNRRSTAGTIRAASSISASVVDRPSDSRRRRVPRPWGSPSPPARGWAPWSPSCTPSRSTPRRPRGPAPRSRPRRRPRARSATGCGAAARPGAR